MKDELLHQGPPIKKKKRHDILWAFLDFKEKRVLIWMCYPSPFTE